jgi:nitrate reductase gamma subunit
LRWGSNLLHIGILGIFLGHLVGLLTPVGVWHAVGVSAPAKQMLAIVAGGIFGAICFIGLALLDHLIGMHRTRRGARRGHGRHPGCAG